MDQFQMDHQALYHLLKIKCERETLDDIWLNGRSQSALIKITKRSGSIMDQFQMDHQALYHLLKIKCERETLDDILQGMRTLLADEAMPTAEQVRAFLQAPDGDTALDPQQQMVAMDQMLQCMEVNFRTCCDLLRYQQMKKASAVRDMDEFLDVLYPGNTEEEQDESV